MNFYLIIPFISILVSSCCTNGIRYTGSLRYKSELPHLHVQEKEVDSFYSGVRSFRFGCNVKINAGRKFSDGYFDSLKHVEYQSISQKNGGESTWHLVWEHDKYGKGEKVLKYNKEPIYAVDKRDFKLGLVPSEIANK